MIAGAASTLTAIALVRVLARLPVFSLRAALAEAAREGEGPPGPAEEAR
jgi:hypothetical protein